MTATNMRFWRFGRWMALGLLALPVVGGPAQAEPARELASARAAMPPEVLPYSSASGFRRRIAARPRIDPRSGAIVSRLRQNIGDAKITITTQGDVPPVYRVTSRDPFYRVSVGGRDVRFRVPRHAESGSGQDHPLVLLDRNHPDLGRFVELRLYQAHVDHGSGRISSSGAGLFHYDGRGSGAPFLGSGTGSGLSILSGLVRPREVVNGRIEHAIRFSYSQVDFIRGYRAPAIKSDQPRGGYTRDRAGAMVMGMRLQLDPKVRCDRRTVPGRSANGPETRFLRILCRALQEYGMIVVDGTGENGVLLQMENEATAPWARIIGPHNNGNYGFIIRDTTTPGDGLRRNSSSGIPWHRMRVIAG